MEGGKGVNFIDNWIIVFEVKKKKQNKWVSWLIEYS